MSELIAIYIEDTSGNRYECEVHYETRIGTIAADFFEALEWPEAGANGQGNRAVVELVYLNKWGKFKKSKRLRSEHTLLDAEVENGSTLRIYPEAIAGAIDPKTHLAALISDYRDIQELTEDNENIKFETPTDYAPSHYTFYLKYKSFVEPPTGGEGLPKIAEKHEVKIKLSSQYPLESPNISLDKSNFPPQY